MTAEKVKSGRYFRTTPEEIELAIAFLRGEVTAKQLAGAVGMNVSSNSRFWVTTVLRLGHRQGLINLDGLLKAPEASRSDETTKEDPE